MPPFLPSLLLVASLLAIPSHSRTLFAYERVQLTREHVASLSPEDAELFAFDGQFEELVTQAAPNKTTVRCRYVPGDDKWPSSKAWTKLAKSLSSVEALIQAVPQASVCFPGNTTNDAKCEELSKDYGNSYLHVDDPTEILSPVFQGLTCTPPKVYNSGGCSLGGYPSYVIKVKTVADIQYAINFARNDGVRLVVKNTGHDFAGKSAGAGALSIWTHGLKEMQFIDNYVDESGYKGPVIKAGAGVQAFELYKFANEKGVVAVAGEGQTVGVMGGYILGGGHSPLSSIYGIAADHVLGFEIVTPLGDFITVNSTSEPDLFWALKGGGGGTFGVVTSVTIKTYKDIPITTATWTLDSATIGKDKFWAGVKALVDRILDHVDAGTYSYYNILPSTGGNFVFNMAPLFAPNKTAAQFNTLLGSYFSAMTALNIPFTPKITEYKSFYPAWQAQFPLERMGGVNSAPSSRLFPRSNFASETGRNITFSTLRQTVESGLPLIAFHMSPKLMAGNSENAVNPAWRTAVMHAITRRDWPVPSSPSSILSIWKTFTTTTMQKWRDVAPGSGSYLNEADRLEPNWQQSFWGSNYARLADIKKNWDRKDVFWAVNAVGSEGWTVESVDSLPNENGKLCKVATD